MNNRERTRAGTNTVNRNGERLKQHYLAVNSKMIEANTNSISKSDILLFERKQDRGTLLSERGNALREKRGTGMTGR